MSQSGTVEETDWIRAEFDDDRGTAAEPEYNVEYTRERCSECGSPSAEVGDEYWCTRYAREVQPGEYRHDHPSNKPPAMRLPLENRFWSKVDWSEDRSECWEWDACTGSAGYGRLQIDGRSIRAHRIAYLLRRDGVAGMDLDALDADIRHAVCHNLTCCNPNHLKIGDRAANMRDSVQDDRRHGLSIEDRIDIRIVYRHHDVTQCELADRYDVAVGTVSKIVNRDALSGGWPD